MRVTQGTTPFMLHNTDLIERCTRNDRLAQKQLYEAYAPMLMGVCYRYTKSSAEASDVLQEGFVKIFKSLHTWKQQGPLIAWMRSVMVRTSLNWLRQHRKLNMHSAIVPNDAISVDPADDEAIGYERLEAAEILAVVRTLPAGYQTIFNLHGIEGYSHVEIASILDISESTSRTQYMRARRMLQQKLQLLYHAKQVNYGSEQ